MSMCSLRSVFLLIAATALPPLLAQVLEPAASEQKEAHTAVRYVERELYVPDPMARPRGLDALEVPADLPGKHPLALLTHGTSGNPAELAQVTPWAYLPQALWFARRGYVAVVVVRRGYGRSGGELDGRQGGCGNYGSFKAAAEAGAEDLRATARYVTTLSEVDSESVLSVGVSSGGLAQVALSANPMPGLTTAISFAGGRGGDGSGSNCNLEGLISAFHSFGKHNKVPMLWIYSENDKWFPPSMARQFNEAFRKSGGTDDFVMAPPDGSDGHHLYSHIAKWSPIVDDYLRKRGLLPLGDKQSPLPLFPDVAAPAGLNDAGITAFRQFLLSGPFRAFATNGADSWGSSSGRFNQQIADSDALEHCKRAARGVGTCRLVERSPQ